MIGLLISLFMENINVVLYIGAFLIAAICSGKKAGGYPGELLRWVLFLCGGVMGVYTFVFHVFFSKIASASIGWAPSPFEYEVGIANLAMGVTCLMALRASYSYKLAAGIALSVWLGGDAVGHVIQMVSAHDFSSGNAGSWFWTDILIPVTLTSMLYRTRPSQ